MSVNIRQKHERSRTQTEEGGGLSGSALLGLSLYVILLAFFIVLNSISYYAEPKVDDVFESLDITFAARLEDANFEEFSADERDVVGRGQGESLEAMQEMLNSILPGLDAKLTENPNDGKTMSLRMEKDKFDRLSAQLIPVFARILNAKDRVGTYSITMTSYVRDSLTEQGRLSFESLVAYKNKLTSLDVASKRIAVRLSRGNPALISFRFERNGGGV